MFFSKSHYNKNCKVTAWAKPYSKPIESINTGLNGVFKFSPKFINCEVSVFITLTGRRKNDYLIAEEKTGKKHIPGKTVWHHVWNEKNGKYEIQLVDFKLHQSTCPHAGGCRLWELNNYGKRYQNRYSAIEGENVILSDNFLNQNIKIERINQRAFNKSNYNIKFGDKAKKNYDIVIDYKFPKATSRLYDIVNLSNKKLKWKGLMIWGLDPYGNLILQDRNKNLYFFNHEEGKISPLFYRESRINKN